MFRKLAARLAFAVVLTAFAVPPHTLSAQSVITGSDPQPSKPGASVVDAILPVLMATLTS